MGTFFNTKTQKFSIRLICFVNVTKNQYKNYLQPRYMLLKNFMSVICRDNKFGFCTVCNYSKYI